MISYQTRASREATAASKQSSRLYGNKRVKNEVLRSRTGSFKY